MPEFPGSPVAPLRRIIGRSLLVVGAFVLAGCSMLRLAYDQAPNFAYWWIDSYVDVDDAQSPRMRDALDRWFAWHRRNQLPEYAALLSRAQREIVENVSAAGMCGWTAEAQRRIDIALEEGLSAAAELMLTLTLAQLRHLERRFKKNQDEMRDDFLQPDLAERKAESLDRALKRSENLYGRLDSAQRDWLAAQLDKSAFDPERWLAERRLRQQETLRTLTNVAASARASTDRTVALAQARTAARSLAEQMTRSPRADYRTYQQRLMQENCAVAAGLHNLTTPAQRQTARVKLKGWEDDLRALVAAADSTRLPANSLPPPIESR